MSDTAAPRPTVDEALALRIAAERHAEDDGEGGVDSSLYVDPACPDCEGTGYVKVDDGGLQPREHICTRCVIEGRRRHACQIRVQKLFGEGGSRMTLARYKPGSFPGNQAAWEGCVNYVKHFPAFAAEGAGFALQGEPGCGKAQPLDARILTPGGWKLMGDIQVGDEVCDPTTGKSTRVVGVYPQGEREIYRVAFSDGTSTESDLEHLWNVRINAQRDDQGRFRYRTMTLAQIKEKLEDSQLKDVRFYVPMTVPLAFKHAELPVAPYLMGALLGDGGFRQSFPVFSSEDPEVLEQVAALLPADVKLIKKKGDNCDYCLTKGFRDSTQKNPLTESLRELGLFGLGSQDKFIPEPYLFASLSQRAELLRGLLDTDGSIDAATGRVEFTTASPRLAEGVVALVQSMGGRATPVESEAGYRGQDGARVKCKPRHHMTVTLPIGFAPFYLSRKADLVKRKKYEPTRRVVSVVPVGVKPAQCIQVDSPSQLYLTDSYIVTHNTHLATGTLMALIKRWPGRDGNILNPFHLSVPEMMDLQRKRIRDEGIEDVISRAQHADITLLDDIGAERHKVEAGMSWVDEQLYLILNYRLTHNLPTLYTTNLNLSQLKDAVDSRIKRRLDTKTLAIYPIRKNDEAVKPDARLQQLLLKGKR